MALTVNSFIPLHTYGKPHDFPKDPQITLEYEEGFNYYKWVCRKCSAEIAIIAPHSPVPALADQAWSKLYGCKGE